MLKNIFKAPVSSLLAANSIVHQQIRTTFVLKRKNEVPLYKKNQSARKLRGRHFVYDLVEDTNTTKKPNIDVILTTYVEGVGRKGEIVSVKPGLAYEKLLLPGLAVYNTPINVEKYTKDVQPTVDEEQYSSQFSKRTKDVLERRKISIVMNKDHPWEIEKWHIRSSLRKSGIQVLSDDQIELPAEKITGPDLTKQNKEFICFVTINNCEKARVRCRIHHWSTDPSNRLPYSFEHWLQPAEPLFGDESNTSVDEKK